MKTLLQDLRYGLRTLAHNPTFSLFTVLILALGIGLSTAIFTMVNALFFSSLPIKNGETLAFPVAVNPQLGIRRGDISIPDFLEFREQVSAFQQLAAVHQHGELILTGEGEPIRLRSYEVTADLFEIWGTRPVMGRGFFPEENGPGAERVVVLSHGLWKRRYGADSNIIGKSIDLDDVETTVVGIMDPSMEFGSLSQADVWIPLSLVPTEARRDDRKLWITGKLRDGATLEQARQEVAAVAARLEKQFPETNAGWTTAVLDFNDMRAKVEVRTIFFLLQVTVFFVMLIACSNVATMMLQRGSVRGKEIALRTALGASRARLVRQLLTESTILALGAGALGVVFARSGLTGLTWIASETSGIGPFFRSLTIDSRVLVFTLAASLLAPLLFALLPALRTTRLDLQNALKEGAGRSSGGRGGFRGRRFLVGTQIALALTLMVVAGLLIRAVAAIHDFDLGFETEGVLTLRINLPDSKAIEDSHVQQFFNRTMARIEALPEVESAAWVSRRPLHRSASSRSFLIQGRAHLGPEQSPLARVVVVGPRYHEVMRIPLMRGRAIDGTDTPGARPVALVNEELVNRYWPEENPIGQRIKLSSDESDGAFLEVVGVVGSIGRNQRQPAIPVIYLPFAQHLRRGMALVARTEGEPLEAAAALRSQVSSVDPDQPVSDIRTMTQIRRDFVAGEDSFTGIFAVFALVALIMAAAGIYGVVSFSVSQRTHEIGIRMALGAKGGDLRAMILRQALWLIAAGAGVGSLLAFACGRVLASGIPDIDLSDPLGYAVVGFVLGASALLAGYMPARRATEVDPAVALRTL